MPLIETAKDLRSRLDAFDGQGQLALVPTMGALHHGHIALVEKALDENENVVVSIFVNPTQFNNKEDLKQYPKTLAADVALLHGISKKLLIFAPSIKEVYGRDITSNSYDFGGLDRVMEGAFREGHFNGVGTVVETLFKMVGPDRAYFGEKDFQQLQIIKKLVERKRLPVEIIGCPIVRESNGLAMSSRNERLSSTLRTEASFIYKTLQDAKNKFGTKSARFVTDWVKDQFKKHDRLELEYIQIADVETLSPVARKRKNVKYRAFVAVYAEGVRLIDNIALN
jgi:pantoate--beta-alanine ligase